jgi:signal transduction histidine kinase
MRLAVFISKNLEEISVEWEKFAATLLPDQIFSVSVLRDGIKAMLKEIAADMQSAQTADEQREKSEGASEPEPEITPAERHALARVTMGLSSLQLISEFRALRATVVRLWQKENVLDKQDVYDLTRFHEAIDQALSEATATYAKKIEDSRNLFLGILGHDLRTPLGAVSGAAQLIAMGKAPEQHASLANIIVMSAGRMAYMITDLLELTRVHLGQGIMINSHPTEIRKICIDVLAELQALSMLIPH